MPTSNFSGGSPIHSREARIGGFTECAQAVLEEVFGMYDFSTVCFPILFNHGSFQNELFSLGF